jgi:hypothetical protein
VRESGRELIERMTEHTTKSEMGESGRKVVNFMSKMVSNLENLEG